MHDRDRQRRVWVTTGLMVVFTLMLGCAYLVITNPDAAAQLGWAQLALVVAGAVLIVLGYRGVRSAGAQAPEAISNRGTGAVGGDAGMRTVEQSFSGPSAQLAQDLKRLSDQAVAVSGDAAGRVQGATTHLAREARSLELLYDVAASINVSRDLDDLLARSIRVLKEVVGAHAGSVRLVESDGRMRMVASIGTDKDVVELKQKYTASAHTIDTGEHGGLEDVTYFAHLGLISVPLPYRNRTHGVIDLYLDDETFVDSDVVKTLLTSVGRHLGMAIERHSLDHERERLSRMEERTRMAHELHDSLAQTLASLRFQVRVLDETLHQQDESAVWQEMERVENSLDEAHIELRELISRFRAPIDQDELVPAIAKMVNRFENETGIATFLQNEWASSELPRELEVEVIRIVQEALANARKHSHAHALRVMLRSSAGGEHRVLVEDDGIGITSTKEADQTGEHIGLIVMQERAQRLGGEIKIDSEPNEGTRVVLTFRYPLEQPEISFRTAAS
jgi:two-component system nitrate/nitrite sensor histidine kinase NarX